MLLNYNFLKIKLEIWVKIRYFYYKYQEVSSMEEFNAERKSSELSKEEVSIYTNDCGVTRYNCVTDCFGVLALITEEE